jgi:lipopolysaccharide/colanic/teichoic acid biosynthesis glycosyltransferase
LIDLIIQHSSPGAFEFMSRHAELTAPSTLIVATTTEFNIIKNNDTFDCIVNLSRVNNFRFINKMFEKVNSKINFNGVFISCVETIQARKERHRIGHIPILKNIVFSLEFIFLRVFPKVWGLKKIYFLITKGRNRLLSKAEVLGRLVSCGFEIVAFETHNGLLYTAARKIKLPEFNMSPSYALLFKMKRVGKNGKMIGIYKLRTMHPFAEYLQDYILRINGYAATGKPDNDFRLTPWGRVLRKYWLDELPQLINVLKGELKLVGVRPISQRYFNDIPQDLQAVRLKFKPGCIPPYVSLNRSSSVESVLNAEREYLEEKIKHPYFTDTKYFFKALYNIVVRRKRSA